MALETIPKSFKRDYVTIDREERSIKFKIQDGPIKEAGLNGCQVDMLIKIAMVILNGLNRKFPSPYNERAIDHLSQAVLELDRRRADREARGVEGYSKA